MRHTKEPWVVCEDVVEYGDMQISASKESSPDGGFPYPIAWMEVGEEDAAMTRKEMKSNAERIVSCVNTCAGIRSCWRR